MSGSVDLSGLDLRQVTRPQNYDAYLAVRAPQGRRLRYTLQLQLGQVPFTLPTPDPHKPMPGNRRVDEKHALAFGDYVVENPATWVCPPLLLRVDEVGTRPGPPLYFEPQQDLAGGLCLGILHVRRGSVVHFKILDGQHRVLGVARKLQELTARIDELEQEVADLEDSDDALAELRLDEVRERLSQAKLSRQEFSDATFTIDIYVESEAGAYKQMFYDIAQNAKGMTQSVKVRFDSRKVVNRAVALPSVTEHPLLKGRLEIEKDRVEGTSANLISAKILADVIRAIAVGYSGRISSKQEAELTEEQLAEETGHYLDILSTAFTGLAAVRSNEAEVPQMRKSGTLLLSATMWRVLAGVFHILKEHHTREQITEFFHHLDPLMDTSQGLAEVWSRTGQFQVNAPDGRREAGAALVKTICSWYGMRTDEIRNWTPPEEQDDGAGWGSVNWDR
jgi:DNA-sulfur modification-associated